VASLQEDRRRTRLRYLGVESAEPDVLRDRVPETVRPPLPGQPFQTPDPADEPAVEAAPEVDDRVVPADSLPAPVDPAEPPMQLERDGTTEL
jgi:hypothetical protein